MQPIYYKTDDWRYLDERELDHDTETQHIEITQPVKPERLLQLKNMAIATKERLSTERKLISVKIPQTEITSFKLKSEQEGLKYQTKLNQLIYLYNRGLLHVA